MSETAGAPTRPHRFGPVVLAGLMTAALLAVTSAKAWTELTLPGTARAGLSDQDLRADMPLALALSLVVLAAWGVVLVSRRRARQVVLAVALLADLGVLVCVLRAPSTLPGQIRTQLALGHAGTSALTPAYFVATVAALAGLVAIGQGLKYAPRWPEMSSRYDAPAARPAEQAPAAELADLELWKALDDGQDPTAR